MQYNNEECIDILKRLITANKDRIDHYTQAIELLNKDVDADLIMLFEELTQQSQQFKAQITPLIYREGDSEHMEDSIINSDLKSLDSQQTAVNRAQILQASEQVEAQIRKIYHEMDGCNDIIEDQVKELIASQSDLLEKSHSEMTQRMETK